MEFTAIEKSLLNKLIKTEILNLQKKLKHTGHSEINRSTLMPEFSIILADINTYETILDKVNDNIQ